MAENLHFEILPKRQRELFKPMPSLLRRVAWREIKKRILSAHSEYLGAIK